MRIQTQTKGKAVLSRLFPSLVLTIFLVITVTATQAQTSWTNRYNGTGNGNDEARAIAADSNGNVLVTGRSVGTDSFEDCITIKYSNAGIQLWTNSYNGPSNSFDYAVAIAVDANDNVFVAGYSWGSGSNSNYSDYVTIKYSNTGTPLWTNRCSGNVAVGLALNSTGDVFVTGFVFNNESNNDYATVAYSNVGTPLWTNIYNGPGNGWDQTYAIAVDGSGNVFVTGYSLGTGTVPSGLDYATIAYSNNGLSLWTNRYNGLGNNGDGARAIAVDGNGNVFVTGSSRSASSSGSEDYATIAYSNAGLPLWTNLHNGSGNSTDQARAIAVDGSGNVFVTGYSRGIGSTNDYATIKYSNAGVPLWTNRYNGPVNGDDTALAIAVDGNGNAFVTGSSRNVSGKWEDFATVKYSNAGLPLWTNLYDGGGSFDDAFGIAVDGTGNAFVAGRSDGDYAVVKYGSTLPQITSLGNLQAIGDEFSFTLTGEPGGQFAIQVSTNLVNWNVIQEVIIAASGSTNIVEIVGPGTEQKFYRALRQ